VAGVDVEELVRAQLGIFADLLESGSRSTAQGCAEMRRAQAIGLACMSLRPMPANTAPLSVDAARRRALAADGDIFAMTGLSDNGPPVSDQSAWLRQQGRRLNGEAERRRGSSLITRPRV